MEYPGVESENYTSGSGDDIYYIRRKTQLPGPPAEGGDPGDPGIGGRVFQITINASAGQQLTVVIGKGGKGGAFSAGENTAGEDGTDTTVGEYSTASGQVVPGGFLDPINNVLYGGTGKAGIKGGSGGGYLDEQEFLPENLTIDGATYSGGLSVGLSQYEDKSTGGPSDKYGERHGKTYGGYGGGPAFGADGGDGGIPDRAKIITHYRYCEVSGAKGGDGATALPPPKASVRGRGGGGGNGGGAPGSSGKAWASNYYTPKSGGGPSQTLSASPDPGTPGNGSDGGEGADGVLLIYY